MEAWGFTVRCASHCYAYFLTASLIPAPLSIAPPLVASYSSGATPALAPIMGSDVLPAISLDVAVFCSRAEARQLSVRSATRFYHSQPRRAMTRET